MLRYCQRLKRVLLGSGIMVLAIISIACLIDSSCHPASMISSLSAMKISPNVIPQKSLESPVKPEVFRASPLDEINLRDNDDSQNLSITLLIVLAMIICIGAALYGKRMVERYRALKKHKKMHIFSKGATLTPSLSKACQSCGEKYMFPIHLTMSAAGVWVIEISLTSSQVRTAAALAVKDLTLPVIRRELNLIIIGAYKNKSEPTEVIKLLKKKYDIRGWLVQGN